MAEVVGRILVLEVTPALEGPVRPRADRHDPRIEDEMATADPLPVNEGSHGEEALAAGELAANHPIERAAFHEFGMALGRHAGGVDVLVGLGGARQAATLLDDPVLEVLDRVAADAQLEKMEAHDAILLRSAPIGQPGEAPQNRENCGW